MKYLILVGTDYSEASDLALEAAFELASNKEDAQVHVVNVWLPDIDALRGATIDASSPSLQRAATDLVAYVSRRLAAFQERHAASLSNRIFSHVRVAEPGREIAQLAADLDADLVVVGTHDRRGIERLLLSSVAHIVSRLAPCPVLIVRPKAIPVPVPAIEPPCHRCVEARFASDGAEMWCEQHRERHGQRHTYHQGDRVGGETNFPLVLGSLR
ncbi:MAG: universal stress protein [Myxococcales bacterium]|jgi:nucleotide-binding universal stress UspA family protein